jgi:hypothetical protein
VFEEGATGGQVPADGLVALIGAIKQGREEKRQEREAGEDGGVMLFAVAVVMLEPVALGLEPIVVLVLDRPAAASGFDNGDDVGFAAV